MQKITYNLDMEDIMKITDYSVLKKIRDLPEDQLIHLACHPLPAARYSAVRRAPIEAVPVFINDPDPDVRDVVNHRLKS